VATTIYEVLDGLRSAALSETDKGAKFERLMKAFLTTDPAYADQFKDVWLWQEWSGRGGKHDTGIDLVAQDRLTEGYVAIQCKFYAPTSTISKDDIDTFLSESGKEGFVERIVVSTTDKWNGHAENAIKGQQIPVRRIGMADLEASPIDWGQFSIETPEVLVTVGKKSARPHQERAIEAAVTGFAEHERGKLIMACGTGKTFTSLHLAEQMAGAGGSVLFLVPSISLLSQTLREWSTEAEVPLCPLAVCSDRKSTARSQNADEDIATVDLALPATTNTAVLTERLQAAEDDTESMTVVFSTYQSIDAVARADRIRHRTVRPDHLRRGAPHHRHHPGRRRGRVPVRPSPRRRLHPRRQTALHDRHAPHLRRRHKGQSRRRRRSTGVDGQREAIRAGVLPTRVRRGRSPGPADRLQGPRPRRRQRDGREHLPKPARGQDGRAPARRRRQDRRLLERTRQARPRRARLDTDPAPMRRAVAFAGTIKASKKVETMFEGVVDQYVAVHETDDDGETVNVLDCQVRHVDGTFNALERNTRLDWLRGEVPDGMCRILTNARCLSEGVDVPALDSVMFLSPRKSIVDVVQSVGRVMRKAPGKKYGYIILPIAIPEGVTPEAALRDNSRYQVVWEVLQALRAHDDRLNAEINKIDLTKKRSDRINVIGIGGGERASSNRGVQGALALNLQQLDEWRDAVYARIVSKVGSRRYWEDWAKSVAQIAEAHITRITALLNTNADGVAVAFDRFLDGLRANLNESIARADAIEMLAQHLITRPVFDALFGGYDFAAHNPVAQAMEQMLATLDEQNLETENADLEKFYDSVRMRVQGIDTAEGRQRIIVELYDTFFSTAFKRTVDRLGIVYTPVEIVDFILRSADEVLRAEFGQGLTDENVHILDGFVGTGTFITRLIQSGLIAAGDLPRKYQSELHANEILLLAYYIAAVNVETSYQDVMTGHVGEQDYVPFPGLILTDTFQSWEDDDRLDYEVFRENNERLERLKQLPITVIVGNPPYSVGQESANDDNRNEAYPTLDAAIRTSYVARSSATLSRNLYDSYVRAIKWATLRIADRGVIAYVTNGGWLDANTADGMRLTLADEFSSIYVYNLRGKQRTAGEQSRREGGKIFGGGSRATVAITLLVKNPTKAGPATLHYADIGDYLSREEKLEKVASAGSVSDVEFTDLAPNQHGDWLNQRRDDFAEFMPAHDEQRPSVFSSRMLGVSTSRDSWVYNFSKTAVTGSVETMLATYARERAELAADRAHVPTTETHQISWSAGLVNALRSGRAAAFQADSVRPAMYRPFTPQWLYSGAPLIERPGALREFFPAPSLPNVAIYVVGFGSAVPFTPLIVDSVPNLHLTGAGSGGAVFARWRYLPSEDGTLDFTADEVVDGYRRIDNVTDDALRRLQKSYGGKITKDDIFNYVYGLLHSPDYRETYAADLKKLLPRVPLVADPWPFINAGRALSELHLGYETVGTYALGGLDTAAVGDPYEFFRVEKLAFAKVRQDGKLVQDKSQIIYNARITVSDIPDAAHRYMVGARTAVEWIIDRYQVKTDKASAIVNDPNDWSREVDQPRYILDLLARTVTVSVETMKIVDALPPLQLRDGGTVGDR